MGWPFRRDAGITLGVGVEGSPVGGVTGEGEGAVLEVGALVGGEGLPSEGEALHAGDLLGEFGAFEQAGAEEGMEVGDEAVGGGLGVEVSDFEQLDGGIGREVAAVGVVFEGGVAGEVEGEAEGLTVWGGDGQGVEVPMGCEDGVEVGGGDEAVEGAMAEEVREREVGVGEVVGLGDVEGVLGEGGEAVSVVGVEQGVAVGGGALGGVEVEGVEAMEGALSAADEALRLAPELFEGEFGRPRVDLLEGEGVVDGVVEGGEETVRIVSEDELEPVAA